MARKLKTETNTPGMRKRIKAAWQEFKEAKPHGGADIFFEHGQHYVSCKDCGAQWSVNDAEGYGSIDGFSFEEIEGGDESCANTACTTCGEELYKDCFGKMRCETCDPPCPGCDDGGMGDDNDDEEE